MRPHSPSVTRSRRTQKQTEVSATQTTACHKSSLKMPMWGGFKKRHVLLSVCSLGQIKIRIQHCTDAYVCGKNENLPHPPNSQDRQVRICPLHEVGVHQRTLNKRLYWAFYSEFGVSTLHFNSDCKMHLWNLCFAFTRFKRSWTTLQHVTAEITAVK